jgi:hypothetical protein
MLRERIMDEKRLPLAAIFLSYIFLFNVLPTGKCGTGKYLSLTFRKTLTRLARNYRKGACRSACPEFTISHPFLSRLNLNC